jgi:hypothetical protein
MQAKPPVLAPPEAIPESTIQRSRIGSQNLRLHKVQASMPPVMPQSSHNHFRPKRKGEDSVVDGGVDGAGDMEMSRKWDEREEERVIMAKKAKVQVRAKQSEESIGDCSPMLEYTPQEVPGYGRDVVGWFWVWRHQPNANLRSSSKWHWRSGAKCQDMHKGWRRQARQGYVSSFPRLLVSSASHQLSPAVFSLHYRAIYFAHT